MSIGPYSAERHGYLGTVTRVAIAHAIKVPFTMPDSQAGSIIHNACLVCICKQLSHLDHWRFGEVGKWPH